MTSIVIVGEAWGKDEEAARAPFVGASGRVLNYMLHNVGIDRKRCFITNVFNLYPERNDVESLCGPKSEGIPGMPYLRRGKYVNAKYASELDRLYREIQNEQPNVIIALGATAAWALMHTSGIRQIRGAPAASHLQRPCGGAYKVLPTYHPSAVIRDWSLNPVTMADLAKAKREAKFPEVRRPAREIWIEPDLADLFEFEQRYIEDAEELSIDIETIQDQITCVGFAPTKSVALVVPFYAKARAAGNYWRTYEEECEALAWVARQCQRPISIFGQNFIYDMRFLWEKYGIPVPGAKHDTMLLHHALQPELQKGLGFLGTIYTDEASWKFMRKNATVKKED